MDNKPGCLASGIVVVLFLAGFYFISSHDFKRVYSLVDGFSPSSGLIILKNPQARIAFTKVYVDNSTYSYDKVFTTCFQDRFTYITLNPAMGKTLTEKTIITIKGSTLVEKNVSWGEWKKGMDDSYHRTGRVLNEEKTKKFRLKVMFLPDSLYYTSKNVLHKFERLSSRAGHNEYDLAYLVLLRRSEDDIQQFKEQASGNPLKEKVLSVIDLADGLYLLNQDQTGNKLEKWFLDHGMNREYYANDKPFVAMKDIRLFVDEGSPADQDSLYIRLGFSDESRDKLEKYLLLPYVHAEKSTYTTASKASTGLVLGTRLVIVSTLESLYRDTLKLCKNDYPGDSLIELLNATSP